jgi:hypothetical protein
MVKICQTGLLKLNFETRPKKHIFRFLPKISAGHGWSWKFFFANFQILGPVGCQGWMVIPQNVKKVKITAPYCTSYKFLPLLRFSDACKLLCFPIFINVKLVDHNWSFKKKICSLSLLSFRKEYCSQKIGQLSPALIVILSHFSFRKEYCGRKIGRFGTCYNFSTCDFRTVHLHSWQRGGATFFCRNRSSSSL